jgi:3-hydroxyisobutyrate dehydrogenase-like beta-hydroxyacid dehydrogenase
MSDRTHTLGFIGTGQMGSRMIQRLLAAGYSVTVYNRTSEKASSLKKIGANVADSIETLVTDSDIILSSLANDAAVEDIYLSPQGVARFIEPGTIVVELSSIRPETTRKIYDTVTKQGGRMIDAAVSGSIIPAEEGSLVIFIGGDEEAYTESKPILEILGKTLHYLGKSGNGSAMKLVVNDVLGIGMAALAEAVRLGEASELARGEVIDVLTQTAVVAPAFKLKLENMKNAEYPPAFKLSLMLKDMDNILAAAEEDDLSLPVSAAARQLYAKARDENFADKDFSAVFEATE